GHGRAGSESALPELTQLGVGLSESERRDLLIEALGRALVNASGSEPALAILEDLRDDLMLEADLLERLAWSLAEAKVPVLLCLVVRTDAARPGHGLPAAEAPPDDPGHEEGWGLPTRLTAVLGPRHQVV